MPTPYLFFDGRCEEAIEFYKKALGAECAEEHRAIDSPVGQRPLAEDLPPQHKRL